VKVKRKIFSICLSVVVLVALIAVLVPGCTEDGADTYALTMAENPAAGGTATDETGGSPYEENAAVNISAVAASCYRFVGWTSSAGGTFGDANAATTNFTMPDEAVTVTANFELTPPDHYKFYDVYWEQEPEYINKEVLLEDQFGTFEATVKEALLFGNPAAKEHNGVTPISDDNRHYTYYKLDYDWEADSMKWSVEVTNQFQEKVTLTVDGPVAMAVPTQKLVPGDHEMVECINHYLVYQVVEEPEYVGVDVNLKDQFIPNGEDVTVGWPLYFANPVKKTVVESGDIAKVEDADLHWVLYDIGEAQPTSIDKPIQITNQFGDDQILDLTYRDLLAVPSEKDVPPTPPLDHFKCYQIQPGQPLELEVDVWDQFHDYYLDALVGPPLMFCNPVEKKHGTVTTSSNDDNHLTVYLINTATDWWTVTVDNQFGNNQELIVFGPVALAVPTQKVFPGDHGLPKYLDHYLLYEVWEGSNVTATVDLDDQFPGTAPGVKVTQPVYFANPALKGYVDYEPGMWDPEEHLLFYRISDNGEFYGDNVMIRNQFFPEQAEDFLLIPVDQYLAAPSVKVEWAPTEPPIT